MGKITLLFALCSISVLSISAQKNLSYTENNLSGKLLALQATSLGSFRGNNCDSGLVAFFPFNGNTSDSSGNGHHSTSNGVTYTYDRFGNPNSAAEFNGEMNKISLKGFRMSGPGSTLAFWVLPTPETDTIMVNTFPLSLKIVLRIVNKHYNLDLTIGNKKIHLEDHIPINFDPANPEYDFIAIHYADLANSIILNVNQISGDNHFFNPGEIDNLFPLTVKKDPVYFFRGKVDDVRIYSRNLTPDELNTLNSDRLIRIPEVKIDSVSNVGYNYARLYTSLIDEHGSRIKAYGIWLSTHPNPDTSDTHKTFTLYSKNYTFSNLLPGTNYYVRVWVENEAGIGFSNVVSFTTPPNNLIGSLIDIDGNVYRTVKIGTQTWMADNLKTTRYADGTPIGDGDIARNSAKSYFRNIEELQPYGLFYTWNAVTNVDLPIQPLPMKVQGVCPDGWHVPTTSDYSILINYLGGPEVAGAKLRIPGDEFWEIPNGTNESGFNALGLGYVGFSSGTKIVAFIFRSAAFFALETDTTQPAVPVAMQLSNDITAEISFFGDEGTSVRCLQDTISTWPGEEDHKKNEDDADSFDMYPNPASDVLNFPNLLKPVTITIYDTQSRVRLKTNVTGGNVDISFLPKGIYFIHISDGTSSQKKKFVK